MDGKPRDFLVALANQVSGFMIILARPKSVNDYRSPMQEVLMRMAALNLSEDDINRKSIV